MSTLASLWSRFSVFFVHLVLSGTEHKSAHTRRALLTLAIIFTIAFFINKLVTLSLLRLQMGHYSLLYVNWAFSLGYLLALWLAKKHLIWGEIMIFATAQRRPNPSSIKVCL